MDIQERFHKLLTDPSFLALSRFQTRPNLFATLAASHTEMWHSAFVKWLLDPKSHLGLGDYPLKRFLFTVIHLGQVALETQKPNLFLADIENMMLSTIEFDTEFTDDNLTTAAGGKGRIDIIGASDKIQLVSGEDDTALRIIIENKIRARESTDQTKGYFEYARLSLNNFDYNLFVFLTPDDSQMPDCQEFIQVTYQQLCDYVIKPCLTHPLLPEESRYLLEQYLINLGIPIRGGKVMALPNKELCEKIYRIHKEVLDEIFVSVRGEAPQSISKGSRIRSFSASLDQLVGQNIIALTEKLFAIYRKQSYCAELQKRVDGKVVIRYDGQEFETLSNAAMKITGTSINGWNFWTIKDNQDQPKTLAELRQELDETQNIVDANT